MNAIIIRIIKDRRTSLILYCLAGILLIWLLITFFPIVRQQAENIKGFLESIPTVLLKAFGIENLNIFTIEGFLTYKHYSVVWPLMLVFLTASLAGYGLSGAVERGTIEIPLSCPVSRLHLFFSLYIAGLFTLIIFAVCSVLVIVPLGEIYHIEYIFSYHISVAAIGLLFGWAVFSLTMLLSAIYSEQRKTYMVLGGILFAMYLFDVIPAVSNTLAWMKYLSLFYYYDPNYILANNAINSISILVFAGFAVACTAVGAFYFKSRDISV